MAPKTLSPSLNEVSGEIAGALAEGGHSDDDDDHEAEHLDRRQHDVELHRLGDASGVDGGHDQDEDDRGEHERQVDELGEIVAGEGASKGARRSDARGHHSECHDEGEEGGAEGLVGVKRGSRGARVLRHQLGVGEGGEEGEHERGEEGCPDGPSHLGSHLADEGIDTGAENVADHEYRQHAPADRPPELRPYLAGPLVGSALSAGTGRCGLHAGGVPMRR